MALYAYEAFSKEGKKVRGVIDAPTPSAVKEQLSRQGLYPTSIKLAEQARLGLLQRLFARGVSSKEKILLKLLVIFVRTCLMKRIDKKSMTWRNSIWEDCICQGDVAL